MLGLDVIEVMTPSGHPSIINKKILTSVRLGLDRIHLVS